MKRWLVGFVVGALVAGCAESGDGDDTQVCSGVYQEADDLQSRIERITSEPDRVHVVDEVSLMGIWSELIVAFPQCYDEETTDTAEQFLAWKRSIGR